MDIDSDSKQQSIHKFFTRLPSGQESSPKSPSANENGPQATRGLGSSSGAMAGDGHKSSDNRHSQQQPQQQQQQPRQSQRANGNKNRHDARRAANVAVAAETRMELPNILTMLPHIKATKSQLVHLDTLPPLRWADCPRHNGPTHKTRVRVVDADSFNAAIELSQKHAGNSTGQAPGGAVGDRVLVLNMASHTSPGGGWIRGATAQEEALCYRSSLSLSLHQRFYPMSHLHAIYSPDVVVIRDDMASGHRLLVPKTPSADLPVVSVVSVAAIRCPALTEMEVGDEVIDGFARDEDRRLTMAKMRLCLRTAASTGHGLLVLGALGCGAFRNPPHEVVQCWQDVLEEAEFGGGWWKEVWFAVLDNKNDGNLSIFKGALDGLEI